MISNLAFSIRDFVFIFIFRRAWHKSTEKFSLKKFICGDSQPLPFFHEWCSDCTQHVHVGFGNEKNLIRHHAISLYVTRNQETRWRNCRWNLLLNFLRLVSQLLIIFHIHQSICWFFVLCRWFVVFVAQRRSSPERLRRPAISGRRWRISAAVGQQRIDFIFIARRSSFIRIFRFWWRQLASPRRQSPGRPLQRPVVRTQIAHLRSR
jgi:hypothetical protein